jgi:hypothetical protein
MDGIGDLLLLRTATLETIVAHCQLQGWDKPMKVTAHVVRQSGCLQGMHFTTTFPKGAPVATGAFDPPQRWCSGGSITDGRQLPACDKLEDIEKISRNGVYSANTIKYIQIDELKWSLQRLIQDAHAALECAQRVPKQQLGPVEEQPQQMQQMLQAATDDDLMAGQQAAAHATPATGQVNEPLPPLQQQLLPAAGEHATAAGMASTKPVMHGGPAAAAAPAAPAAPAAGVSPNIAERHGATSQTDMAAACCSTAGHKRPRALEGSGDISRADLVQMCEEVGLLPASNLSLAQRTGVAAGPSATRSSHTQLEHQPAATADAQPGAQPQQSGRQGTGGEARELKRLKQELDSSQDRLAAAQLNELEAATAEAARLRQENGQMQQQAGRRVQPASLLGMFVMFTSLFMGSYNLELTSPAPSGTQVAQQAVLPALQAALDAFMAVNEDIILGDMASAGRAAAKTAAKAAAKGAFRYAMPPGRCGDRIQSRLNRLSNFEECTEEYLFRLRKQVQAMRQKMIHQVESLLTVAQQEFTAARKEYVELKQRVAFRALVCFVVSALMMVVFTVLYGQAVEAVKHWLHILTG